jgi:hypothetical protein
LGCDFGNTVFNSNDVPFACNNKILAAKSYGLGLHGGTGDGLAAGSYHSARDEDGHGSHTASTAAGNADVMASISGTEIGMVSGIAPRARLSIYKACWHTSPTESECLMSDLVAAIDRAIADGVDVINLSIGSNVSSLLDPIDLALLNAVRTGIFVVTAAGNNGPDLDTIGGTPASVPWVTTVAASSHDRTFQGTVLLENGSSFFGASITDGAGRHRLVDAATLGNALCNPDLPFSASVASQLVLCMRGEIARLAKSLAVWQAAGVGMILYNASDDETQITDNHYVPTIHINNTDGLAVKAYIANAGAEAMASLQGGAAISTQGSVIADFSSRGIALAVPDIIKPDVTAPGVNILAANTPTGLLGASGELFQVISGTSMSTPHVAGMFALLKQAHPDWSPAIAKSALMTTARQDVFKEDGVTAADPFDYGAGHIAPGGDWHSGSIVQPGLVYDAGIQEYFGFLCGNTQSVNPTICQGLAANTVPFDASDLNLPSIGISQLIANQTVVRTVTSVVQDAGVTTFQVSVEPPSGFDVRVSPQTLSLEPGQTATYDVTIINNGQAVSDTWAFGALTWREAMGRYTVRSPMAVRAVYIEVPKELSDTDTTGTQSFDVTFGYAGDYHQAVHGLVAAAEDPAVVLDDPGNDIVAAITCWFTSGGSLMTPGDPACGLTLHLVEVAAGATLIRFSLFDAFTDGSDDLDVLVWHPSGTLAGGSGSTTSAEQVDVPFPEMGTYSVLVHGWQTAGPDANYTLFSWEVGPDAGNMTVSGAPTTVSVGDSASLSVDWFDLETGKKYLGVVSHHNGPVTQGSPDALGLTVINVDTN